MLGRQKIKLTITSPGDLSPKLYSGTLERFAASFPNTFQKSLQAASHVAYKK